MVGYLSASKNSGERKLLSRFAYLVSRPLTSSVASTELGMSLPGGVTTVADLIGIVPLTFESIRCTTVNCALEWPTSAFHVSAIAPAGTSETAANAIGASHAKPRRR